MSRIGHTPGLASEAPIQTNANNIGKTRLSKPSPKHVNPMPSTIIKLFFDHLLFLCLKSPMVVPSNAKTKRLKVTMPPL